MSFENPFSEGKASELTPEQKSKNSELGRLAGREMRTAGFGETMKTDQYSAYHTEGEHVADHYRTIFNVMQAVQHPEDQRLPARLAVETREALAKLDPSVAETIRDYPTLIRYVVLAHDIAKKTEGRTVNPKNFRLPESEEPESLASKYALQRIELESNLNAKREEVKTAKKDPQKTTELKKEVEELEKQIASTAIKLYDDLRVSGLSGKDINERYGLGVGFIGHEKASAEITRNMNLPEDLRGIMAQLADDHMLPLQRFSDATIEAKRGKDKNGAYKKSEEQACAESYRDTYKDYSEIEFRLSAAMAALDILGSLPKNGKPNLAPIDRMLKGEREVTIQDMVKDHLNDEIQNELLKDDSPYTEFRGVDLASKDTPIELKKRYSEFRNGMEKRLREKFEGDFNV